MIKDYNEMEGWPWQLSFFSWNFYYFVYLAKYKFLATCCIYTTSYVEFVSVKVFALKELSDDLLLVVLGSIKTIYDW